MQVVHLVPALFDAKDGIIGGAERYAFELAHHMAHEVPTRLVTFGDEARRETIDGLEVQVLGPAWYVRGQRTNPLASGLIKELRRVEIVHCHQAHVLASSLSAVFCRLTGRRVFVTDLGGGGWDLSAFVSTDRWYHGHLHLSEFSRRGYGHDGKSFASVILGGVDTSKFSPPAQPMCRDRVVFVGRMLPHKGIDILIDAMPEHVPLHIYGRQVDNTYFADLQRMVRAKPVFFHRDADDAAIVEAYRRALCVVLPSVNSNRYGITVKAAELLGQTLLEGMACEAPAIGTALGGMPEVVQDGTTGFILPPGDSDALRAKIRWLRDNPDEVVRMGAAGRKRVFEHFIWPRVVSRCLAIYGAS